MFKILKNRLEQGYRTMSYPAGEISLPEAYRGRPAINQACPPTIVQRCAAICPQEAIDASAKCLDLGRCVFCGRCEAEGQGEFVQFTNDFDLAVADQADLITDGNLPELATRRDNHFHRLFGRSLALRQVSAGGCGACEADINVLNTPAYDLSRFGISYVASPRHADGIHVTGPVSHNMRAALLATWEAIPAPKVVIASGACAIAGGPFFDSPEVVRLDSILPVDLYIPGCPPHPLTILQALLQFFK